MGCGMRFFLPGIIVSGGLAGLTSGSILALCSSIAEEKLFCEDEEGLVPLCFGSANFE